MSATNSFESEVLRHILMNEPIANIGNVTGLPASSTAGYVYICLLKLSPGEDGSLVNEAEYSGYARVPVARGSGGWSEANGLIQNIANITFPECTGGSEDITYFGICKTATGDDLIFYDECIPFPVSQEMQPQFQIGQLAIKLE